MTACEKCWEDAHWLALLNGTPQVDAYQLLVAERGDHCDPATGMKKEEA